MKTKTIRLSEPIEKKISEISKELNISLNATMLVLLKLGIKMYDGQVITDLKE